MTRLLANLLNVLPPRCSYLFPDAVVKEAMYIMAAKIQVLKLEQEIHS